MSSTRLAAPVRRPDIHPSSRHSLGLPGELNNGSREEMEWPAIVIVEQRPDGVFLDRLTAAGDPAGDTWHMSVEEAKDQAADEYEGALGKWIELPPGLGDEELVSYVVTHSS